MLKKVLFISLAALMAAFFAPASAQDETPEYTSARDIPVEVFAQLPRIEQVKISPNGENLAILYPLGDETKFVIFDVRKEPERDPLIIDIGDGGVEWLEWVNDDRLLVQDETNWITIESSYFSLWLSNGEGLVSFDRDGKNMTRLLSQYYLSTPGNVFGLLSFLEDDPKNILVEMTDTDTGQVGVYKLNVYDNTREEVIPPREDIFSWAADYDDRIRYGLGVRDDKLIMIARAGDDEPWLELQNNALFEDMEFRPMGFSFDSDALYVRSSLNSGRDAIYEFSLSDGVLQDKVYEHPKYDVGGLIFSTARKKLVAATYVDDYPTLEYFDDEYREMREKITRALGGERITVLDQTADEHFFIIRSYSSTDPGTLYIYDNVDKELSPIWEVMPGLDPALMSEVKPVTYYASDGLELNGYVTIPRESDGKNLPTIILPHGGPWVRDDMVFDPLVQFLASRGYAVFQVNFRGSTGYGDRFEVLGYGEWGGKMQDDISDGVRWLIREGIADPDRICIVGASYGGYAALMGLAETPDLYECGIAIAPVTDIKEMMKEAKEGGYDDFYKYSVVENLKKKDLKRISPVKLAKQIEDPVLLIHGSYDTNVPIEHSEKMAKALKKAKADYDFIVIDEAGHSFIEPEDRITWFKAMEDFLAKNLPAAAPSAPSGGS